MVLTPEVSQALYHELVGFRRELHRHPEVSLREYETTAKIRQFLVDHEVEILDYPLETGLVAIVRGRRPGPSIAIRADIDALPIHEETGLPFASQDDGKMHACGHDFHTSAVLGAAILAKEVAASDPSFAGSIVFVFQPAEEVGQGAQTIINTGVFSDLRVEVILGEHNKPDLPSGQIGVKSGPLMGSVDEFRIVIQGVGGHAAIPERTVDPILVASHVVTGLQHIVSRAVSPFHPVVVTVGQFLAGTARNVIPSHAVLEGTVRCLEPADRDLVEQRLRSFVQETSAAFGATAKVEYIRVLPNVENDLTLADLVAEAAANIVGSENVVSAPPTLGGEDFAIYQQHMPGCFFWVGTGKPYGWHHPSFDIDEKMIPITSQVFAMSALLWLQRREGQ